MLQTLREASKDLGLSVADVMRQSIKLGLPTLRQQLSTEQTLKRLRPFTQEECRQCWEVPNPEFDALEHHCASLPPSTPEE
jgi:hypothetical protein